MWATGRHWHHEGGTIPDCWHPLTPLRCVDEFCLSNKVTCFLTDTGQNRLKERPRATTTWSLPRGVWRQKISYSRPPEVQQHSWAALQESSNEDDYNPPTSHLVRLRRAHPHRPLLWQGLGRGEGSHRIQNRGTTFKNSTHQEAISSFDLWDVSPSWLCGTSLYPHLPAKQEWHSLPQYEDIRRSLRNLVPINDLWLSLLGSTVQSRGTRTPGKSSSAW